MDRAAALTRRAAAYQAELEQAACLLVPSRAHARRLAPLLGLAAQRLRVMPYGRCRDLARAAKGVSDWHGQRPLRVLHFGHLSLEKGTLDLVHAMSTLPTDAAELCLLGRSIEPAFEHALHAAAGAMGLDRAADGEGGYGAHELARVAATCDLAAFPSRLPESYGIVVDEALALGLPVWVSDQGALSERVGGAGRVLPARDPAAWTQALRGLLAAPQALAVERECIPESVRTAVDAALELEQVYAAAVNAVNAGRREAAP